MMSYVPLSVRVRDAEYEAGYEDEDESMINRIEVKVMRKNFFIVITFKVNKILPRLK